MEEVSGRYEILDILSQDEHGIVFAAHDRESDREVVLRRFFPFGADGGGLEEDERTAYENAIRRLKNDTHPSLRQVLDGGTDPVDGMPFLVTEAASGPRLSERLAQSPLSPPCARILAETALETSRHLSRVFGEEAIWIETLPSAIYFRSPEDPHPVSFRISPRRWLGQSLNRNGLQPILDLVETATGWNGRMISDRSGGGLGGWVKALRKNTQRWSIDEALASLQSLDLPINPDSSSETPTRTVPRAGSSAAVLEVRKSRSIWPWITTGLLTISVVGLSVFLILARSEPTPPVVAATQLPPKSTPPATASSARDTVNLRAEELASQPAPQPGDNVRFTATIESIRLEKQANRLVLRLKPTGNLPANSAILRNASKALTSKEVAGIRALKSKKVQISGRLVLGSKGVPVVEPAKADDIEPVD